MRQLARDVAILRPPRVQVHLLQQDQVGLNRPQKLKNSRNSANRARCSNLRCEPSPATRAGRSGPACVGAVIHRRVRTGCSVKYEYSAIGQTILAPTAAPMKARYVMLKTANARNK